MKILSARTLALGLLAAGATWSLLCAASLTWSEIDSDWVATAREAADSVREFVPESEPVVVLTPGRSGAPSNLGIWFYYQLNWLLLPRPLELSATRLRGPALGAWLSNVPSGTHVLILSPADPVDLTGLPVRIRTLRRRFALVRVERP